MSSDCDKVEMETRLEIRVFLVRSSFILVDSSFLLGRSVWDQYSLLALLVVVLLNESNE